VHPQNAAERAHAEQLLRVFGQSTDYITHCKVCTGLHKINVKFCYFLSLLSCDGSLLTDSQQHEVLQAILDNSQSPYAQLLASSSLLKVITDHTLRYGLSNCQEVLWYILTAAILFCFVIESCNALQRSCQAGNEELLHDIS